MLQAARLCSRQLKDCRVFPSEIIQRRGLAHLCEAVSILFRVLGLASFCACLNEVA